MLRYFRSFDFQSDGSKQQYLANLVQTSKGDKVLYALKHMDAAKLKMTPAIKSSLNKVLDDQKGNIEFVELVTSFKLQDRSKDLMDISLQYPDSAVGKESMRTLLAWNKVDIIKQSLNGNSMDDAQAVVKSLQPHMYNPKTIGLMESLMKDSTKDLELRKLAVKTFAGPWQAEDRLLVLAKENKIPAELHTAAGGVFQNAWRATLRDEAARYLKIPGMKEGTPLPAISVMVDKKGDPIRKTGFSTSAQIVIRLLVKVSTSALISVKSETNSQRKQSTVLYFFRIRASALALKGTGLSLRTEGLRSAALFLKLPIKLSCSIWLISKPSSINIESRSKLSSSLIPPSSIQMTEITCQFGSVSGVLQNEGKIS